MSNINSKNLRLRVVNGIIDENGSFTVTPNVLANSGENLVTSFRVQLPNDIFIGVRDVNNPEYLVYPYRVYLEFLLPDNTRYISEPLAPYVYTAEGIGFVSRQPGTKEVLMVEYKVPRYLTKNAGTIKVSLRATNDSVTLYKSKVVVMTVDDAINPEDDNRYYSGDLLDWIVANKIDNADWINGILYFYRTDPSSQHRYKVDYKEVYLSHGNIYDSLGNSIEIVNDQFTINIFDDNDQLVLSTTYTINLDSGRDTIVSVTDGTNYYEVTNNQFTLNDELYTIVLDRTKEYTQVVDTVNPDNVYPVEDDKFTIDDIEYEIGKDELNESTLVVKDPEGNIYPINKDYYFTLNRYVTKEFLVGEGNTKYFLSEEEMNAWLDTKQAAPGQFISVKYYNPSGDKDEKEGWFSKGYIVNPDGFTVSEIGGGSTSSYPLIEDKPTISTDVDPGVLEPRTEEELGKWTQDQSGAWIYNGDLKLTKVAKTGKLSDTINDINLVTQKVYNINSNTPNVIITFNDTTSFVRLDQIIVNSPSTGEFSVVIDDKLICNQYDIILDEYYVYELGYLYIVGEESELSISSNGEVDISVVISYN